MKRQKKTHIHGFSAYGGWLLAGLAFALRLAYLLTAKSNPTFWVPQVDSLWYFEAAKAFAQGSLGDLPFFRVPFYPAVLGVLYHLFGPDLVATRILNALIQSAAVWALFRVGYAYFSPLVAWIAASLLALNGIAIFFSVEILTTSFELLATVCAIWATLRALDKPTTNTWILCGLTWGMAAIIRPNFLILLPLVCFLLIRKYRSWLPRLLPWIIGVAIPILPVTLTNLIGSGEFVLLATQGGVNCWIGNNPKADGMHASLPGIGTDWTIKDTEEIAAGECGRRLKHGELSGFYYRKALNFIIAHPAKEAWLLLRKTLLFFNRFEISNNKHLSHFIGLAPWLPPLTHLNFGLLLPLSVIGVVAGRRKKETHLLVAFVLLYAISVILFFTTARFRMPVVPVLCVLAALAIEWFHQGLRTRRGLRSFAPLLLLLPATALTFMNPWHLREEREGWAFYAEGNAYKQLKKPKKAEIAFRKALDDVAILPLAKEERDRQARSDAALRIRTWNNLGTIREFLKDTAGAIAAYSQALAISPNMTNPRINLARLYYQQAKRALSEGRNEEAVRNLRESIRVSPERAATHVSLAIALGRLGNQSEALHALETALSIDSTFEPARRLIEQVRAIP